VAKTTAAKECPCHSRLCVTVLAVGGTIVMLCLDKPRLVKWHSPKSVGNCSHETLALYMYLRCCLYYHYTSKTGFYNLPVQIYNKH